MAGLGRTIGLLTKVAGRPNRLNSRRSLALGEVRDFGANPGALRMLMYAPPGFAPQSALVVVLHGCTQSAETYAVGAGWIEAADRLGFAVLCPEQTTANNPNVCFNWFVPGDIARGRGEAASIAQMIAFAAAQHDIDPKRVFVTGLSAGGAMANVMLATYPELFAAGAIIAGLPYGCATNVQEAFAAMAHQRLEGGDVLGAKVRRASQPNGGPWPSVAVWHGASDVTVSPAAGEAIVRQWVDVHGAGLAVSLTNGVKEWRSASGDVVVKHVRIANMGHGAPISTAGGDPIGTAGPFLLDVGISSTAEILETWGFKPMPASKRAVEGREPVHHEPVAASQAHGGWSPASLGRRGGIDVGDVINNALRSAGLLK